MLVHCGSQGWFVVPRKQIMVPMQFLLSLVVFIFLTTNFGTLIAIGASLCVKETMPVCGDRINCCECFFLIIFFVLNIL